MIEVFMIHKKIALIVRQVMSKNTVKQILESNVFNVCNAIKHLFGKRLIIKFRAGNIGLNYGSLKVTVLGNYAPYPATVNLRSGASRITGLIELPRDTLILKSSNTFFMMPPVSIKMAV